MTGTLPSQVQPVSQSGITSLKGIGKARALLFERLGVSTVGDLLYFLPRDYQDRRRATPIAELRPGQLAAVRARVCRGRIIRRPGNAPMAEICVADQSGQLRTLWFRQPYMVERLRPGRTVVLYGKVGPRFPVMMAVPEYELLPKEEAFPGNAAETLCPIYRLTSGLGQALVRKAVRDAVERFSDGIPEIVPPAVRERHKLLSLREAVRLAHFPPVPSEAKEARRYFAFEELFVMQVGMALRRRRMKDAGKGRPLDVSRRVRERILRRIPFSLTPDQGRALDEILQDMASSSPMNRLLQGEVGSGKTVVAFCACLAAVANRCQAAFMAPTEVLAEQQFRTFADLLRGSRVRILLHTGGLDATARQRNLERIRVGDVDIVVGTHALTEQDVSFRRLGLVVVDEQHKFGVFQRALLYWKGRMPDVLVMTATPIPRTLALSAFGDLDFSTIRTMPPGRGTVRTHCVDWSRRDEAYRFLEKRLEEGAQAFVICPLIETDEEDSLESAVARSRALDSGPLGRFGVGLLHGRMPREAKAKAMREFRRGRLRLMVATSVAEVGIDVRAASVMVVEDAHQFGLAQLHQMRGRISRSAVPADCFLIAGRAAPKLARKRMELVSRTSDGFRISEEDLRMRGPGEFFGTRQHGLPRLKIADLIQDFDLLMAAQAEARKLVERDPGLLQPANRQVAAEVARRFPDGMELVQVS